jgi:hypothetical protein
MIGAIIAAWSGYVVVRALARWCATIRMLGLRRTGVGVRIMWGIRWEQLGASQFGERLLAWPIPPTVPLLFELQVALAGLVAAYLVGEGGLGAVAAVLRNPVLVPLIALGVAHASESLVPPCMLYLGVSEHGQFASFGHFGASYSWLTVSAIDQDNPDVSTSDPGGVGLVASLLMPSRIGRVPMGVIWQQRRLESIRTTDDRWADAVRQVLAFVPAAVVDLRTWSAIVSDELRWILESGAASRTIALTRDDGTTAIEPVLRKINTALASVCYETVTEETLRTAIEKQARGRFATIDAASRKHREPSPTLVEVVSDALQVEQETKRTLLRALGTVQGPSAALDRDFWTWAFGAAHPGPVEPLTGSVTAALRLLQHRLSIVSSSLGLSVSRKAWADVGVQIIADSYRRSSSVSDEIDTPAKALLICLLRAELGMAEPQAGPRPTLKPPNADLGRAAAAHAQALIQARDPTMTLLLDVLAHDGLPDPSLDARIAAWLGQPAALARFIDDFDACLDAVASKMTGSILINITIDGYAWAEVGIKGTRTWLIALSFEGRESLRPPHALLVAAIKAELGLFSTTA